MNKTQKRIFFAHLIILLFLSILTRIIIQPMSSDLDYWNFLRPWILSLQENPALSNTEIPGCNYLSSYIWILRLVAIFPNDIHLIILKLFSYFFDYLLLIIVYFIALKLTNDNYKKSFFISLFVAILPTFVFNSAILMQCDSIYVFFLLLSFYSILNKRYNLSLIFYGIAFSIKIQSIFMLPIFGILFFQKKIKFKELFIVPIVYFITCVPDIILSQSLMPLLMPIKQMNSYSAFSYNAPSIFNFSVLIENTYFVFLKNVEYGWIKYIGIIIIVATTLFFMFKLKNTELNNFDVLNIVLFFSIFVVFFLYNMHERYFYLAEVLSIIAIICNTKYRFLFLLQFINLYHYFVSHKSKIDVSFYKYFSLIEIVLFIIFLFIIYKEMNKTILKKDNEILPH